ncbi:hypothetical protein SIL08_05535 [Scandinavium sp. V105_16]|uniref:Uncharacterized protein n=1 Tax=Scandinavium lactucae TaxID=3095028 RepID=A0AAJ2S6K7_9ENTR|nr:MULTISPECIES: hypothetical protein [unclassified Scandinavium]MDX6019752.1 hypothetical protein [Scandinavium sp. V105_16]MDX6032859.1 hypothetical protein [Scandinavium sp. V105_12]MDX6041196.1 hypothetical protein [Scandinavium sp. V105_6]MDX6049714.1 hypothetical protein [Scandinavium sp. V105_1]
MSEKEHDMTNDGGESVTYTLRNIPADIDRVITDLATHARKPKATFLREFLEDSFRDVIDSFSLKNPLIASLDEELACYLGAEVMEKHFQSHYITRWNQEYQKLLGISSEDELRRVVLNNTPYLQVRAAQVLKGCSRIPRGISLTFSLFAEIAGRDRETIDRAWNRIFYSQLQEKKHRFYQDIEAIRALKKLPVLSGYRWTKDDITVRIYRPEDYAYGAWRIAITLPENYAIQMWNIPFPELEGRRFTADPGYSALISAEPDRWDQAFRFVDGACELHLYTNGVEEDQNPTPLPDVAQALLSVVEYNLL